MASEMIILGSHTRQSVARDNDIATAALFGAEGSTQYALGILADYSAAVALVRTITFRRSSVNGPTIPIDAPTLQIGTTDRNVKSVAFQYAIGNVFYVKAAVAAGTALAAGTIPIDTWGVYRYSINAAGTIASTAGALNFTTGYASSALALAGLPALPASSSPMGYVLVQTKTGTTFVGGTDSLTGGASGNVANATTYADEPSVASTKDSVDALVLRWDFTNGPCYLPLPGVLRGSGHTGTLSVELQASGSNGITGRIALMGFTK